MKVQYKGKNFDKAMVDAIKAKLSFFAWLSIDGIVEKCELKIKTYRKDYNEIELEVCEGQAPELAKVISGNRIINIYVPDLAISFSTELKAVTVEMKVKIYPPENYTFYERRKHERVQPEKPYYVNFEYNKFTVRKLIFDISLGGFAIVLPKSDRLNIEKISPVFILELGVRRVKIKVMHVNSFLIDRFMFEDYPYGGYKLAFRFVQMSKEDKVFFAEFITKEIITQKAQRKAN